MPESRNRKKESFTPPPSTKNAPAGALRKAWVAPVMVTCFIIGLLWIVVFYLAGTDIPGMNVLGNWNLLVGMGLIAIGFVISTQWH